jgi:hypothetical protein
VSLDVPWRAGRQTLAVTLCISARDTLGRVTARAAIFSRAGLVVETLLAVLVRAAIGIGSRALFGATGVRGAPVVIRSRAILGSGDGNPVHASVLSARL